MEKAVENSLDYAFISWRIPSGRIRGLLLGEILGISIGKVFGLLLGEVLELFIKEIIRYKRTSLIQGDPLEKENPFYYEILHKKKPISLD